MRRPIFHIYGVLELMFWVVKRSFFEKYCTTTEKTKYSTFLYTSKLSPKHLLLFTDNFYLKAVSSEETTDTDSHRHPPNKFHRYLSGKLIIFSPRRFSTRSTESCANDIHINDFYSLGFMADTLSG